MQGYPDVPMYDVVARIYPAAFAIRDEETSDMLGAVLPDVAAGVDAAWADTATLVGRMRQSHRIGVSNLT